MRLFLRKVLEKGAVVLHALSKKVYQFSSERRVIPWFKAQGDNTLRLDYDLDENSVVFDLGGYKGQWSSDIYSKYCCFIHIFEPIEEFAEKIENKFTKNKKITVHKFGLSSKNEITKIYLSSDSSSIFKSGSDCRDICLVKAIDFIKECSFQKIDLMKINIEGGEYELLEHLINEEFVKNIVNIQVQFHDFVPNAEQRMVQIQERLQATHFLTYQYPFVWENWKLIDKIDYSN